MSKAARKDVTGKVSIVSRAPQRAKPATRLAAKRYEQKAAQHEILTKEFALVASAPNGIQKLRELILDLAMRGMLVPQDQNDISANEFLGRVGKLNKEHEGTGKIERVKALPTIDDNEKPYSLARGWEWLRFGQILDFSGGGQPPKDYFSDVRLAGYVQLIQIRDLGDRPQPVYIKKELATKFCTPDDIMIGRYGASVGKVFRGKHGAYNVALVKIIDLSKAYDTEFLFQLFRSPLGQALFHGISRSAQNGFNKSDIEKKIIPLPPMAEQKRIVKRIEALSSLCDRMEAQQADANTAHETLVKVLLDTLMQSQSSEDFVQNWQRISEHFNTLFNTESIIDTLKQTVLQLAVMGKLVTQNPKHEPADILLRNILAEKVRLTNNSKLRKEKPLSPITNDVKPYDIPKSWVWAKIGDYSLFTEYGISEQTFDIRDGVPVLKMGDIQNGQVLLGGQKKVPRNLEGLSAVLLKKNDILYNRTNSAELVGKTGIFLGEDDEYTFASYLIRIRCVPALSSPTYLNLAMNAPMFRTTQILPRLKQQCGQANVNGTFLKNMLVPIPPLAEQHLIVAKVDELMTLCDAVKARIAESKTLHERLAETLVKQAIAS